MLRHFIGILVVLYTTNRLITGQNETLIEEISSSPIPISTTLSIQEQVKQYLKSVYLKSKAMRSNNTSPRIVITPPNKIFFREYLRCRQLSSTNGLPSPSSCPYDFDEISEVCWKATFNGTLAMSVIEYDHGHPNSYDGVRHGIENCTLERYCHANGTWAMTTHPDIQCKTCFGDGRPFKFDSISIMIETMSLSLSLISLTIAILCMLNVKYVSYLYVKICRWDPNSSPLPHHRYIPPKAHTLTIPARIPLLCKCFLIFRRLHLPRNLLHMHLFVAFIFRSIVKLVFIHLIVGGYTRTMITYTRDKCGNIDILTKSSNLFHIFGCRLLSSLFWYTDAVSQTFIFCEAMFLFTALTSHLFRDRGCLPFVLWGWLSPLIWLFMWVASHLITDRLKNRSTCWLEADHTTYFYYFFYVPYAFYLLVNFGIFLYLVRLLYSKYQSNTTQTNRTGNRHLIKSILILIPLFGLHSLLVIWVFYHKHEGHTFSYYLSVLFKAIFGDLQGFFTSLIYFYFNTEIRYEVLRQVQRTLLSSETVRRSSAGDTLSTRLSTFRRSISRHRQSSVQTRNERRRLNQQQMKVSLPMEPIKEKNECLCPCWMKGNPPKKTGRIEDQTLQKQAMIEQIHIQENPIATVPDDLLAEIIAPIINPSKGAIDNEGMTCDTVVLKNEAEEDEVLSDENDVTFHQSSFHNEPTSIGSNHSPLLHRPPSFQRQRSNSDGFGSLFHRTSDPFFDRKSLK